MRLLNAKTFELEEHVDGATPDYTILSHTWNKDEVLFAHISNRPLEARGRHGFKKIEFCAKQTLEDGFEYCWIDTCCIDKSSSAELSEAINSMFRWYSEAQKCYVYLEDVDAEAYKNLTTLGSRFYPHEVTEEAEVKMSSNWERVVGASKWFTRGWTLQELIAPRDVIFYTYDWRRLGNKQLYADVLARITGIDKHILKRGEFLKESIAERMSWASKRNTTRVEDEAYCLLGLFDINMPLLYGEGRNAFTRLQEEIIKKFDDQSIFSWTAEVHTRSTLRGLLARSPREFKHSKDIPYLPPKTREPYSMTNRGLRLSLPCSTELKGGALESIGVLNRVKPYLAIRIICVSENQYARVAPGGIIRIEHRSSTKLLKNQLLFVRNDIRLPPSFSTDRIAGFSLLDFKSDIFEYSVWPSTDWSSEEVFYRFPVDEPDSSTVSLFPKPNIFTARLLWHFAGRSHHYWRHSYLLFEFHFNMSARSATASGLATVKGKAYSSMSRYEFKGTLYPVKPGYDISTTPKPEDISTEERDSVLCGVGLELSVTMINDEAVIAGTKQLRDLLGNIEEQTVNARPF